MGLSEKGITEQRIEKVRSFCSEDIREKEHSRQKDWLMQRHGDMSVINLVYSRTTKEPSVT